MAMDISKAKRFLNEAQLRQKRYADLKRQEDHFQVGDLVFLSTKNLQKQTAGVAPKLQPKFVGPYEIIKALGNSAYKLQLPREFGRVHDVFHASLLKPYQDMVPISFLYVQRLHDRLQCGFHVVKPCGRWRLLLGKRETSIWSSTKAGIILNGNQLSTCLICLI